MVFFSNPISFRNAYDSSNGGAGVMSTADVSMEIFKNKPLPPHASHPDFGHLTLLVFEAVLEVVCVSVPGYIVARRGLFDADAQKFLAKLNVMLFTPCLIFTKLASQLSADKLVELAVIPFIFAAQTIVSFLCAYCVSYLFGFKKRPRNFVIAMGVFGNSNSLPISLVISLSQTLKGLHWDKIPGDNDDEVAARGILYLLIFQQLGQLVRWSWGYHVLLAPPEKYEGEHVHETSRVEQGGGYRDDPDSEGSGDLIDYDREAGSNETHVENELANDPLEFDSGEQTPLNHQRYSSSVSSKRDLQEHSKGAGNGHATPTLGNGVHQTESNDHITSFPSIRFSASPGHGEILEGIGGLPTRAKLAIVTRVRNANKYTSAKLESAFQKLPSPVQKTLSKIWAVFSRFMRGLWAFMNPPLWAMLAAILVASIRPLQHLFFNEGTFIRNSVTRAIGQSGGVAVPLILVVLGANLARNTLPNEPGHTIEDDKEEKKLVIASLVSRMLLPTIIMAPLLALFAKYVPVSILDDPIFVIVCFLLTGAPSALQLAQICQINGVYMGAMSKLLFQSYVVWILPSTLILVMLALEVVEWAQR
ncbi:hypothetical protein MMC09_001038 [Bachmanniomyces sp. S44760]|nr:hypothetical protein [Bachmanniomyces sp. S44760]